MTTQTLTSSASTPDRAPIEWGWVVAGPVSAAERQAIDRARELVRETLEASFPGFLWRLPLVVSDGAPAATSQEPMVLLQHGSQEREMRAWDFALVVTPRDLHAYYGSYALAVPSRTLAVALLSLARLAPRDAAKPEHILPRRIGALVLHLFGDLNGLWHREEAGAVMHPPDAPAQLDDERGFSTDELEQLGQALADVADPRLEEDGARGGAAAFYLRAAWTQRSEIGSAIAQARPWELPLRLSRLTTAAFSALCLLLLTAEVWDLGTSRSTTQILGLSLVTLGATTSFVLARQRLLLRRTRRDLSEQVATSHVSATLVVLLGMLATYALLFALALAAGLTLYDAELLARWAPGAGSHAVPHLAGLVASLGLAIGSLGASFEGNHYFQHVIYADEET